MHFSVYGTYSDDQIENLLANEEDVYYDHGRVHCFEENEQHIRSILENSCLVKRILVAYAEDYEEPEW